MRRLKLRLLRRKRLVAHTLSKSIVPRPLLLIRRKRQILHTMRLAIDLVQRRAAVLIALIRIVELVSLVGVYFGQSVYDISHGSLASPRDYESRHRVHVGQVSSVDIGLRCCGWKFREPGHGVLGSDEGADLVDGIGVENVGGGNAG